MKDHKTTIKIKLIIIFLTFLLSKQKPKFSQDQFNQNLPQKANIRKDIFSPIINITSTTFKDQPTFSKQIKENLFGWAHLFAIQLKRLLWFNDSQHKEKANIDYLNKVVVKISRPKVLISANSLHKKNIDRKNFQHKISSSLNKKFPNLNSKDTNSNNRSSTEQNFSQVTKLIQNAIQPLNKKSKKRGRKPVNLVLEKFGISKTIRLRELKQFQDLHPNQIMTRNQARLAKMNPEDLITPIRIIWETGTLKNQLEGKNQNSAYTFLKTIFAQANSIIQMYVKISKDEGSIVKMPAGKNCGFYFAEPVKFDAHLVMLARLFSPSQKEKSVIARSIYCLKNPQNRAVIGVIEINAEKIISEKSSNTMYRNFLLTIVHETLHTLAFHENKNDKFENQSIGAKQKNLFLLQKANPLVFRNGHWMEEFLPNDLMVPVSRSDSVISIFTLEFLENQSITYSADRKNLVANPLLQNIGDLSEFFKYTCPENELPKYEIYCSRREAEKDYRLCSQDFVFQTYCDSQKMENNCFSKSAMVSGNCLDNVVDSRYKIYEFEHRGNDSRCFLDKKGKNSYCLKFEIRNDALFIVLGDKIYQCNENFEILRVQYQIDSNRIYNLKLKCPNLQDFIVQHEKTSCPENCHWNGFCSNGKCKCYFGFSEESNCKVLEKETNQSLVFSEISRETNLEDSKINNS